MSTKAFRIDGVMRGAVVVVMVLLRHHELSHGAFWEAIGLPADMASYWQFVMGLVFIAIVLLAGDGLYGRLATTWRRLRGP